MKIGVIGAGAYGTALGEILLAKGHEITYYDPAITDKFVEDVLWDAEMILMVAPSSAVPELLPQLKKDVPIIVATKGLLTDDLFSEFEDVMVLSGPGFADDIKAHKQTYLTVSDPRLMDLFRTDYIDFDKTKDRRGILMCGALKNVYAILAGYLNLKPGDSNYDDFIGGVADEMQSILFMNGCERDTVNRYCGIDDLKLTCNLPSRNYEFGHELASNPDYKPEKTVEGLSTLKRIRAGEIVLPDEIKYLQQLMDIIKE